MLGREHAERDTSVGKVATGHKKAAAPIGDERCLARGTTPLRRHANNSQLTTPFARIARPIVECGDPVTGVPSVAAYEKSVTYDHFGSGRGSEVLFSSNSGPASQLPRFSDPFRLGTYPHHRHLHLSCYVDPITVSNACQ